MQPVALRIFFHHLGLFRLGAKGPQCFPPLRAAGISLPPGPHSAAGLAITGVGCGCGRAHELASGHRHAG